MKLNFLLLMLFFHYVHSFSQNQTDFDNSIFVFTRSTEMKAGYIAEDFNLKDSLSTHIGIGLRVNNEYKIYNVTNDKSYSGHALICDNLESFIHVDGLRYYSIWKSKASTAEINLIINILNEYAKLPIEFDYNFVLQKDNALYCSEFVKIVLEKINKEELNFKPIKKKLTGFYKNLLQRDELEYIPVDFFLELNCFELVESSFHN